MYTTKRIKGSIDFYFFLLLILSLPFNNRITSAIYILWIVSWLGQKVFKDKGKGWFNFQEKSQKKIFVTSISYYTLLVTSLLWSSNTNTGLHTLETKLALLFTPIVLLNVNSCYDVGRKIIYKFFLWGLVISSVICLLIAFISSINITLPLFFESLTNSFSFKGLTINPSDNFYYSTFSKFAHPSYFAMFLTLGILMLRLRIVTFAKYNAILTHGLTVFFLLIIFFLSSRAGILITYFLIFLDILINTVKKKIYKKSIVEAFIFGIFFLLTINLNARKPISSVTSSSNFETSQEVKHHNSAASRVIVWKSALKVYVSNFVLGVGIGDLKPELFKEFNKKGFQTGIDRNYNAHNQYLEDGLNAGIFVNIFLILMFFFPLISNLKQGNYLTVYFVLLIAANFLFESMLEKQCGVIFFSLFYGLLALIPTQHKKIS